MNRFERPLRWYPNAWRDRYGEELAALLEDTYGDRPVPLRCRLSLARSGIHEHLRRPSSELSGSEQAVRLRSGALVVLCAWSAFVVGGAAFAKFAEHWDQAAPAADRRLPADAYTAVQAAGFLGLAIVIVGALLCLPALVRFLRQGGWPRIGLPVVGASLVSATTVGLGLALALWVHSLPASARDSGPRAYAAVGVVWVLMICTSIAVGAAAAVAVVRHLDLGRRVLQVEGVLAFAMCLVMVVVILGTLTWWVSLARVAPGFLAGGPVGWPGSPAPPVLLVAGLLMLLGLGAALVGAVQVARTLRLSVGPVEPV